MAEQTLSMHEQNWVISLYCGIPYHEVRKLDDAGEREFLIQTAALMKRKHEQAQEAQQAREDELASHFKEGIAAQTAGKSIIPPT